MNYYGIISLFEAAVIIHYVIPFISSPSVLVNSLKDFDLPDDKELDALCVDSMQPFTLIFIWY